MNGKERKTFKSSQPMQVEHCLLIQLEASVLQEFCAHVGFELGASCTQLPSNVLHSKRENPDVLLKQT
jgi:hypothetical protein